MYYQNKILKIKKTPTRDALYSILSHSDSPLSAEQLFSTLSGKNKKTTKKSKTFSAGKNTTKTPDLVTIYRTLETFKLAHIVREVTFKDRTARYELIDEHGGHCHHAVCNSCGTTEHIDDPAIEEALHTLAKKFKHIKKVDEHVLEFFGVCKSCNVSGGKKK